MEIYFELKTIDDGDVESMRRGIYLSIKTSLTDGHPIFILYSDFEKMYDKSKGYFSPGDIEPGFATTVDVVTSPKLQKPDFREVLNFLNQKIKIDIKNIVDNRVVIESSISNLLELPWENIIAEDLYITRKIPPRQKVDLKQDNNLLVLMSHAEGGMGSLKEVMNEEVGSIYDSLRFITENNQNSFRIDSVLLSKHTSVKSIKSISWKDYNMAHLIMHGDREGNLILENSDSPEKYKQADKFSSTEFINLLNDSYYSLIVLSMCYSGGGTDDESLAFRLVRAGNSKHVISYREGVGEVSAKEFARLFYENLFALKGAVEETYIASLKGFYSKANKRGYIPMLYSAV